MLVGAGHDFGNRHSVGAKSPDGQPGISVLAVSIYNFEITGFAGVGRQVPRNPLRNVVPRWWGVDKDFVVRGVAQPNIISLSYRFIGRTVMTGKVETELVGNCK